MNTKHPAVTRPRLRRVQKTSAKGARRPACRSRPTAGRPWTIAHHWTTLEALTALLVRIEDLTPSETQE